MASALPPADLRHLCDESGYDFTERDEVGRRNYEGERAAESVKAYTVFGFHEGGGSFAADIYADTKQEAVRKARTEWAPSVGAGDIIVAAVSQVPPAAEQPARIA